MAGQVLSASGQEQVLVPNEAFINDAEMMRDGSDLVLTVQGGETVVIEGYFSSIDAPDIVSPEGGFLSADLVDAFLTPSHAGQYADASQTLNDVSPAGQMTEVVGKVWVMRADGIRISAENGTMFYEGDMIETSQEGAVNMRFADNTTFAISDGARLSVDEYVYNSENGSGSSFFSMLKGAFVYTSGVIGKNDPEDVNIETPVGSIGIRGTVIMGTINPAGQDSEITIIDGAIVVSNAAGLVELNTSYETAQLSSYNDQAVNIGQVDSSYLQSNYSFDTSLSTYDSSIYTSPSTTTAPSSGSATDDAPVPVQDGTEGTAISPNGDTVIAADGGQLPPPPNPLVQQMIDYQLQQQIDGPVDQFLAGGTTTIDGGGGFVADTGAGNPPPPPGGGGGNAIAGGVNSAPFMAGFTGQGGDGSASNPFQIRQLESAGTKIGNINGIDPEGGIVTYAVTAINNLTNAIDVSNLINIKPNGDVMIGAEIPNLAQFGQVDMVLSFSMTDNAGNVTNINGVNITINNLGGVANFGDATNNLGLTAAGGGAQTVWGGAGEDVISGNTQGGDVLLGGLGSDLFSLNDLNFSLLDGGILNEGNTNAITAYATTGLNAISGDSVLLNGVMGTTIDLITGSGNEVKFTNIDNFIFDVGATTILNLDANSVANMTDPNNVLNIWGAAGTAGQYTVNLGGTFGPAVSFTGAFGENVEAYTASNGATVLVHETAANEVNVI